MPEKTPQLSVSPKETQTSVSSLEKEKQLQPTSDSGAGVTSENPSGWKKEGKILAVILAILALAGTLFAAYKLNQKQIPLESSQRQPLVTSTPILTLISSATANWKTYTNSSLGITFKYPENWQVELVGSSLNIGPQGPSFPVITYPIDRQTLLAVKGTYVTGDTLTVTQRKKEHAEYDITEYTLTFKNVPGAGRGTVVDIVEHRNRAFHWQLIDFQFKEIFNLILSTFRFLE